MDRLEVGDKVRLITSNSEFSQTEMTVLEINGNLITCEYLDYQTGHLKNVDFDFNELVLISALDWGFI